MTKQGVIANKELVMMATTKNKGLVKAKYVGADLGPSKQELERAAFLASARGEQTATKEALMKAAKRSTKEKAPVERKAKTATAATTVFDLLLRRNAKVAVEVFELVLKKKKITRNADLGGRKDIRAKMAYRLSEVGLLTLRTVDINMDDADSDRAFRNSTLDRIYTIEAQRDKNVMKLLYDLVSPKELVAIRAKVAKLK